MDNNYNQLQANGKPALLCKSRSQMSSMKLVHFLEHADHIT